MEFRQLRYFVTVAGTLHFGRAADRLQITQPALSKQIAQLEKEIGTPLLARTKRTVQLTSAGQVFLTQARQLLSQAATAVDLTRRTARGEEGQLAIGFTATATHTVLPQLVRDFRQRYPQVDLTLRELCTEAQVTALNQGQLDLAFLHPPIDARSLELYPILTEPFVAVLPPQHPLLQQTEIAIADLAQESLIIHPRPEGPILYDGLIQLCQQVGFQPRIAHESMSLQTRVCLAAAGLGITFVPVSLQPLIGAEGVCRPLANCPIQLELAAAWRQQATLPTLAAFLAIVKGRSSGSANL